MTIAIVGNGEGKYPAVLDETGLFVDSPIQFGPAPPLGLGSLLGGQVNVPGTGDTWKRIRQADFRGGAGQMRQLDLSRFKESLRVLPVSEIDTRLALAMQDDDDSAITWPTIDYSNLWYDYLQLGSSMTWLAALLNNSNGDWRILGVYSGVTVEDAGLSGRACEGQNCIYGWHGGNPTMFAKFAGIGSWTNFVNQPNWGNDMARWDTVPVYWDGKVWTFLGLSSTGDTAKLFKYTYTADEGATAWSSLQSLEGRTVLQRVVPYARQLLLCWLDRLDGLAGKQYLIESFSNLVSSYNFMLAQVFQGVFYFNLDGVLMAYSGTMREIVRPTPPLLDWDHINGGCAYLGRLYFSTITEARGSTPKKGEIWCCELSTGAVWRVYTSEEGDDTTFFCYPGMTCEGDLKVLRYDSGGGTQLERVEVDKKLDSGQETYILPTGTLYLSWADAGYPEISKVWGYVELDCKVPANCIFNVRYSTDGENYSDLGALTGSFDGVWRANFPDGILAEHIQFQVEFCTSVGSVTPVLRQFVYGVALAPDNKHRLTATVVATDDIAGAAAAGYGEGIIRLLEDKARRVIDFDWLGPRAIQRYNGATYSDELAHATTENPPSGTDYVNLSSATTSWALYVLSMIPFSVIKVWMETVNSMEGVTLDLEYWNGSAWVDVPRFTDGTASGGVALGQDGDIVVDEIPGDMALVTVNGQTGFGYRLKWSATLDADCKIDVIQIACRYFLEMENAMMEVGLEDASGNRIYEGRIPVTLTEV